MNVAAAVRLPVDRIVGVGRDVAFARRQARAAERSGEGDGTDGSDGSDGGDSRTYAVLDAAILVGVTTMGVVASLLHPALGVLCVPVVVLYEVGVRWGRDEHDQFGRLRKSVEQPSISGAAAGFRRLDSPHPELRNLAVKALLPACKKRPDAFVEAVGVPPEEVAETLLGRLSDDHPGVRRSAAVALRWLSRAYGETLTGRLNRLYSVSKSADPAVGAPLAVTIGNVGRAAGEDRSKFAKALKPAVTSDDAEVRQAAAIGLGYVPCRESEAMLRHLSADDEQSVAERAKRSLQSLRQGASA